MACEQRKLVYIRGVKFTLSSGPDPNPQTGSTEPAEAAVRVGAGGGTGPGAGAAMSIGIQNLKQAMPQLLVAQGTTVGHLQ